MKVIDNRNINHYTELFDVEEGAIFEIRNLESCENGIYLKTAGRKRTDTSNFIECVCVDNGEVCYFYDWFTVVPLKGSFVIEGEE